MAEEQKQTVFEPAKVIAVGIAAPLASLLTSRFGIAGTLLGLALSPRHPRWIEGTVIQGLVLPSTATLAQEAAFCPGR